MTKLSSIMTIDSAKSTPGDFVGPAYAVKVRMVSNRKSGASRARWLRRPRGCAPRRTDKASGDGKLDSAINESMTSECDKSPIPIGITDADCAETGGSGRLSEGPNGPNR